MDSTTHGGPLMSAPSKKPVRPEPPCPPENIADDLARRDGTRLFRLVNPELYAVRFPLGLGMAHSAVSMQGQFESISRLALPLQLLSCSCSKTWTRQSAIACAEVAHCHLAYRSVGSSH